MKTIVISAINLRAGGPLTILKNCLCDLSDSKISKEFKIIALVHSKQDCLYDNITYLEFPKTKSRLYLYYMEYWGLKKLSAKLKSDLWLSLNDKTPSIVSLKQATYLHNPTPFFQIKFMDFFYSPFLLLYVLLYKRISAINIHKNDYLIVQQDWLRDAYTNLFKFNKQHCIVFPPQVIQNQSSIKPSNEINDTPLFLFASLPRGFKNFEVIGEANKLLLQKGIKNHKIILTLKGNESRYSRNIFKKYGSMDNISFIGVVSPEILKEYYEKASCLIFPSRLETWGLPISEFSIYNKPMLLADMPYAHCTAAGSKRVAFFDPHNATELADQMEKIIRKDFSFLKPVDNPDIKAPYTNSWAETINLILCGV